jgi:hypothetical protein
MQHLKFVPEWVTFVLNVYDVIVPADDIPSALSALAQILIVA